MNEEKEQKLTHEVFKIFVNNNIEPPEAREILKDALILVMQLDLPDGSKEEKKTYIINHLLDIYDHVIKGPIAPTKRKR